MASSMGISLLFLCAAMATAATGATDDARVQEACSHTPHPDFCVSSLLSDPAAPAAEPDVLPGIAIRLAASGAEDARLHASALLMEGAGSAEGGLNGCLRACEQKFADAAGQLDGCAAALNKKDYAGAGRLVEAAAADATSCNDGCKGAAAGGPTAAATTSAAKKSEDFLKLCDVALALTKLVSK